LSVDAARTARLAPLIYLLPLRQADELRARLGLGGARPIDRGPHDGVG
jgi:hypothetical protein